MVDKHQEIESYIDVKDLPYCKGCSHHLIARETGKALAKIGVDPMDVIVVTDIGCHGIIDKRFNTHTVHGLHGRSIALATGISAALADPRKKVIVFIGDGGTTIGINHLISAAHRNIDMTVCVHNNFLYGMTGGQRSDLTPGPFLTRSPIKGFTEEPLDIMKITRDSGAAYVTRILAKKGDVSDTLAEGMQTKGFALIDILEVCPSYGTKENPDLKLAQMSEQLGLPLEKHVNENPKAADIRPRENIKSLMDSVKPIEVQFGHNLAEPLTILLGGSAGEGVQSAANIFVTAAISCGLHATKKGNYPVTVGTGFSAVEIILSPEPIEFTGIRKVDWAVVSTADGMDYLKKHVESMTSGHLLADSSCAIPATGENTSIHNHDFATTVRRKEVNLVMLFALLELSGVFPVEAFTRAIGATKIGAKSDPEKLAGVAKDICKKP